MTVTLTVVNGPRAGLEYELPELGIYVVGRGEDCYPRLPNELPYKDVSRHHCLVSIHRSEVWVRDLHSRNGTYVNGEQIGQRAGLGTAAADGLTAMVTLHDDPTGWHPLKHGDVIALGHNTVLRVRVHVLEEVGA